MGKFKPGDVVEVVDQVSFWYGETGRVDTATAGGSVFVDFPEWRGRIFSEHALKHANPSPLNSEEAAPIGAVTFPVEADINGTKVKVGDVTGTIYAYIKFDHEEAK